MNKTRKIAHVDSLMSGITLPDTHDGYGTYIYYLD
jgi:hypothetical protein